MSQALKEAGIPIQGLPSTVTLGQQLAKNGFYRISRNEDWNAETGDIVLMSWGADMASSGGAGGHVGVMMDSVTLFLVTTQLKEQQGKLSIRIRGMITMKLISLHISRFGAILNQHHKPKTKRIQQ